MAIITSGIVLLVAIAVAGCGQSDPLPSDGESPTASATLTVDADDLAAWVRFRQAFGLRSDMDWILRVAADPISQNDTGIPLLPAELDTLGSRYDTAQSYVDPLTDYGQSFPDEYVGVFIEGPSVIIEFTDHVSEHRATLAAVFPADAPIVVRGAARTMDDLEEFAAQVEADAAWFRTIGASFYAVDVTEQTNTVRVRYKAVDASKEPLILEHFGNPEWMRLVWYGPLPWNGPLGTLEARVVDSSGQPVADVRCEYLADDPQARIGEYHISTLDDGVCEFENLPAGGYIVSVFAPESDPQKKPDASKAVTVPADGTGSVVITIDR